MWWSVQWFFECDAMSSSWCQVYELWFVHLGRVPHHPQCWMWFGMRYSMWLLWMMVDWSNQSSSFRTIFSKHMWLFCRLLVYVEKYFTMGLAILMGVFVCIFVWNRLQLLCLAAIKCVRMWVICIFVVFFIIIYSDNHHPEWMLIKGMISVWRYALPGLESRNGNEYLDGDVCFVACSVCLVLWSESVYSIFNYL